MSKERITKEIRERKALFSISLLNKMIESENRKTVALLRGFSNNSRIKHWVSSIIRDNGLFF